MGLPPLLPPPFFSFSFSFFLKENGGRLIVGLEINVPGANGINTVAFAYKRKPPKKEMRNSITILQTKSSQFFFHCNFPQTLIFFFSFPF